MINIVQVSARNLMKSCITSHHNLDHFGYLIMFVLTVCLGCGEARLPFCILHCIHQTAKHASDSYLWLGNFSPGHLQRYSTSHFYFLVRCLHTLEM
ncbi:hypothetical protein I7I53_11930 [Histoplasma capsulatum var. duboisii H88]|uniref:Uncharacterized protein n=1 Tax=Ajellomyces capsulatus (strain H88) TaxID=544711 RepID=A0A8A1LWS9_AJEC8|nr:hypothetical protein I7I53_11930 [Histoplasma capsulatum var. duboisii H88]